MTDENDIDALIRTDRVYYSPRINGFTLNYSNAILKIH
jgi:hypothetical protein